MSTDIILNEDKDIIYSGFKLHKIGIESIGESTFEQWQECGEFIKKSNGAVHFWIGDWLNYGEKKWGEMYAQAIGETEYEYQTLANDKWVTSKVDFSRRRENLSFGHHHEVAPFSPDEQNSLLEKAEEENLSLRDFKELIRNYKRNLLPISELPEGIFNVIYADPPWQYDFSETESREIEKQYSTMAVEDIKNINVPSADNAALFLWATTFKLREALEVMEAWGFEYKTHAVWDKEIIGMGYLFRGQHESLLVGTKGDITTPKEEICVPSIYREKRIQHSKKPDYFYKLIESYFPNGKYLELFSRQPRKGWQVWGNSPNLQND